jgi:hypothetical protein
MPMSEALLNPLDKSLPEDSGPSFFTLDGRARLANYLRKQEIQLCS